MVGSKITRPCDQALALGAQAARQLFPISQRKQATATSQKERAGRPRSQGKRHLVIESELPSAAERQSRGGSGG